jgi:hypothetical protein
MGVHLVFFLLITTGPDDKNNVLALVFWVLIVTLVAAGSLLDHGRFEREDDAVRRGRSRPICTMTVSHAGAASARGLNAQKRSEYPKPKYRHYTQMERVHQHA